VLRCLEMKEAGTMAKRPCKKSKPYGSSIADVLDRRAIESIWAQLGGRQKSDKVGVIR
jgi:hypothetical protein